MIGAAAARVLSALFAACAFRFVRLTWELSKQQRARERFDDSMQRAIAMMTGMALIGLAMKVATGTAALAMRDFADAWHNAFPNYR
jgi:glycerol uptake facilitator-like aquaporin